LTLKTLCVIVDALRQKHTLDTVLHGEVCPDPGRDRIVSGMLIGISVEEVYRLEHDVERERRSP
jgi:hypothetical protein